MEREPTADSSKSLESFIRPLIGLVAGAVPTIATKNFLLTACILGVFSVFSEVTLPQLLNRIPGTQLKNLLLLLIAFTLLSGTAFEWYMRHDFYGYARGQALVVSYPDKAVKVKLLADWQNGQAYKSLAVGERVVYLGEASPRKEIRLPIRPDGVHFLNAFYRKVRTKSGQTGWIYGSFLRWAKAQPPLREIPGAVYGELASDCKHDGFLLATVKITVALQGFYAAALAALQ